MDLTRIIPVQKPLTSVLADIKPGEHARFIAISKGNGVAGRLTSLGFTPGVDLTMMQNYGRGPLVVTVRGTRVALGREEARNITVEKEQE
jgi:ferrous iron transport protein A